MKTFFALCAALVFSAGLNAGEIRFEQDGIGIDAGSLGHFTVVYPTLLGDGQKPVHKRIETNAAKDHATLKYEGGTELEFSTGTGGKVLIRHTHLSPDVKHVTFEIFIPIAFNQGGKWKIGAQEADFPKTKPAKPHLFQNNASAIQITNYEGKSLTVKVPDYSWVQLTDNREWNWGIYNFKAFSPIDHNNPELALTITVSAAAEGAKAAPLADQFGQSARDDYPDKVKSAEELKADVAAETAYYASLHPPTWDTYGGLPGSKEKLALKATGYFRVEKKDERWLLVDPVGNACFHLGVCAVNPSDDYTLIKGRESAFAWIPPQESEFKTAFKANENGRVLSFHLANMIRKYAHPYSSDDYVARMIARLRQWGFNSIGAFSGGGEAARKAAQFPTVSFVPLSPWEGVARIPGIREVFDPFDEKTRARIEENIAKSLPAYAQDPLIMGYFIVNEPAYEDIPHIVPTLKSTHACKRQLVAWLSDKYKAIAAFNTAWEAHAQSFEELNDAGLAVKSNAAKQDMQDFAAVFLDTYFKLVAESFRKHDPNHLLLGSRLQPVTIKNEYICRAAGKHVDVMSYNYYTTGVDKEHLRQVYNWTGGKPMLLSEFYWPSPKDSGLAGGDDVASQQERGLAYRNYVEQSAALGFVVGIEWFTLVDQAATGRWFEGFNGERANTGLLAVSDRPYKAALAEMIKTNYDIYKVLFAERPPFVFENSKFKRAP